MISILKTEFLRLKKSTLFWVMLGVCALLPCLSAILYSVAISIATSVDGITKDAFLAVASADGSALSTATELNAIASISSDACLLALICSSIVLCREFTNGTMRNVLLAHKTRAQMFFSYLIVAMTVGLSYFFMNFAFTLIAVGPVLEFAGASSFNIANAILCTIPIGICSVLFVQTCVCMFIFTTRKQGLSIVMPLLICMFAPSIFTSIMQIIVFSDVITSGVAATTAPIWVKFVPFFNATQINLLDLDAVTIVMSLLYYLLFSAMFILIGYFKFEKADLK